MRFVIRDGMSAQRVRWKEGEGISTGIWTRYERRVGEGVCKGVCKGRSLLLDRRGRVWMDFGKRNGFQ